MTTAWSSTSGTHHSPTSVYNKQKEDGSGSQQDRNGYDTMERWYQEQTSEQPWNGLIWQETTNKK